MLFQKNQILLLFVLGLFVADCGRSSNTAVEEAMARMRRSRVRLASLADRYGKYIFKLIRQFNMLCGNSGVRTFRPPAGGG